MKMKILEINYIDQSLVNKSKINNPSKLIELESN